MEIQGIVRVGMEITHISSILLPLGSYAAESGMSVLSLASSHSVALVAEWIRPFPFVSFLLLNLKVQNKIKNGITKIVSPVFLIHKNKEL